MEKNDELWTYEELCRFLNIPRGTAYAWVSSRFIPFIRISGRNVRFEASQIKQWLDERRKAPRSRGENP